jgi:hypothetical protein
VAVEDLHCGVDLLGRRDAHAALLGLDRDAGGRELGGDDAALALGQLPEVDVVPAYERNEGAHLRHELAARRATFRARPELGGLPAERVEALGRRVRAPLELALARLDRRLPAGLLHRLELRLDRGLVEHDVDRSAAS